MSCYCGHVWKCTHTSSSSLLLLLTSAFILLDTLLTAHWCVCRLGCIRFALLSFPQDAGAVLVGVQPQAGQRLVVTGTEWLRNPGAPSGQPESPTVTWSQLATASWAGATDWSPRNRDVRLCFSHGRGRDWSAAGVWNRTNPRLLLTYITYYHSGGCNVNIL